jgi:Fe-S cluster assembly iron-binding protein IscA
MTLFKKHGCNTSSGNLAPTERFGYTDTIHIIPVKSRCFPLLTIEMNKLAAKKISEALAEQNNPDLKCRVSVDHMHGDHAHYGLTFDTQRADDVIVNVQGLDLLVGPQHRDMIDGLQIKYLLYPREGFKITNPSKNNHGDH